ncbi:MAG: pantetheine-phosphate adenylyltransferase [Elusimicrobiota bacterium]|nr:pantetheine-phosphate adenylyltransferase [Elusimicrobiota bacterium]
MKRTAIYPGSFDPPTNGHLDVIERALNIFDRLIVAVIVNPSKETLFTVRERESMLNEIYDGEPRIEINSFDGLLVDFAVSAGARTVIRGLRAVSDFEYEFQMALMNRRLNPDIQSVYLMPAPEFTYLSSAIVKEVYSLGGDVSSIVPAAAVSFLNRKKGKK